MGVYLSSPNKEKNSYENKVKNLSFASCSMQGWRTNMEDAHITSPYITDNVSIFGVFDGHGGREVAKFVEKHFVDELKKNPNFTSGNYQTALEETFMKMDEL